MFQISREYWFSAAHRLEGHVKCGRLHGHNYKVEVSLHMDELPATGWIMDFGDVDRIIKPIIEELDHRYIISQENTKCGDVYAGAAIQAGHAVVLPLQRSTAELLSQWLWQEVVQMLAVNGTLCDVTIRIWETPKSIATYTV